jgi:hypothetical protein
MPRHISAYDIRANPTALRGRLPLLCLIYRLPHLSVFPTALYNYKKRSKSKPLMSLMWSKATNSIVFVTFFRHVIRWESADTVTWLSHGCMHVQTNYGTIKKTRFLYKIFWKIMKIQFFKEEIHKLLLTTITVERSLHLRSSTLYLEIRKLHY